MAQARIKDRAVKTGESEGALFIPVLLVVGFDYAS
jgi:hypothetical protein